MYAFFSIVLIAELIIALAIIFGLRNLDRKILNINYKINEIMPEYFRILKKIRKAAGACVEKLQEGCVILKEKKERYIIGFIKNILVSLVLLFSKGKSKKILSAIELTISLRNFLACK